MNEITEMSSTEIEAVSGGLSPEGGIAVIGVVIAVGAAAPIVGTAAVVAGLGGIIGATIVDILSNIKKS